VGFQEIGVSENLDPILLSLYSDISLIVTNTSFLA